MVTRQSGTVNQQFRLLFGAGSATGLDDGQLLERFVDRRDEAAFAALLARYGPLVLGVCRRLLDDSADVEDSFQATFLVLFQKANLVKDRRLLGTWLYKVAFRVALRARAEAGRRILQAPEAVTPAPVLDLEGRELRAVLDEEILRLPSRYRLPVVLCYLEGLSHEQAARRLDCPLGTVNSRLATARQRLRVRLTRRGLAPSGMFVVPASPAIVAKVVVPPSLLQATLSTAQRIANGNTVVVASSATVAVLTEGTIKAMITSKIKIAAVGILGASLAIASLGLIPLRVPGAIPGALAVEPQPKADFTVPPPVPPARREPQPAGEPDPQARGEERGVPVTGRVLMADGSPAAGATVESITLSGDPPVLTRTDVSGRFQLRDIFENCARLHASSADGKHQTTLMVSSAAARTSFASGVDLSLSPALTHEVIVLSGGRPVEGARVAATGQQFKVCGVTGRDGKVKLQLPATERLTTLVAWHPELGVNGADNLNKLPPTDTTNLALLPPAPHTIRVIDPDGKPVGGLELNIIGVRTEDSDWIVTRGIEESHVRTDAEGTATIAWAPRENLKYVDLEIRGSEWKSDEIDRKRMGEGITTVQVRRQQTVEGHLVMPEGVSAEGLLVTGFGFGPGTTGDRPHARARRDGTFTIRVPSDHAYVLGIADLQWASDPWTGTILGKDMQAAKITMKVYPATPATIRVTRGPGHDPVVYAWVDVVQRGRVSWVDEQGKQRTGTAGVTGWLWTDARGVARTGLGHGEHELRLSSGKWSETRKLDVVANTPVEVEFHRPWAGERHITGRLMHDGARYTPSPAVKARAWAPQPRRLPLHFKPEVRPDGTLAVDFDAENLSLLVLDLSRNRSGFVQLGQENAPIELSLVATATYTGTLLDEEARPLADRTLQLDVKTANFVVSAPQRTDKAGRFQFMDVPANVPLQLSILHEDEKPEYYFSDGDRLFNPGEIRENDRVKSHRRGSSTPITGSSVSLAQRVANLCRDVRSCGMYALVILQGDTSANVTNVTARLLDGDRVRTVLRYLTLPVGSGQLESEKSTLAKEGWPMPGPGEIVLVALNGDRTTIAAKRVTTDQVDEAASIGEHFLKQHLPPTRDALAALTTARKEAAKTGRRVWIVLGGARCGPCFRLGRWMDEHHALLERDYVIVKVMEGIDEQVARVTDTLPRKEQSIPWHAITEPDGTVLTTSESPLGNVGFPADSVEDLRYFRQMLERTARTLKSDELDELITSISPL